MNISDPETKLLQPEPNKHGGARARSGPKPMAKPNAYITFRAPEADISYAKVNKASMDLNTQFKSWLAAQVASHKKVKK